MSNQRYKVVMNCSEWEDPDDSQDARLSGPVMDTKMMENLATGLGIIAGLGVTTAILLYLFSRNSKK
tara:strand:- start:221 stop:421 length:201 start_codon:yes stop_codon:yes gene_type:complete